MNRTPLRFERPARARAGNRARGADRSGRLEKLPERFASEKARRCPYRVHLETATNLHGSKVGTGSAAQASGVGHGDTPRCGGACFENARPS